MAKKSQAQPAAAASVAVPSGPRSSNAGDLTVQQIPLSKITVRDKRDRTRDDAFKAAVAELAASIAQVGLQQPIGVRSTGDGYELVFGERRFLAFDLLKLETIPAKVLSRDEADVAMEIRAAENFQRAELNDDQKALVVSEMVARETVVILKANGSTASEPETDPRVLDTVRGKAIKAVAERIGWPTSRVRDFAFIGELPKFTRELVAAGRLSILHARVLAQVADPDTCDALARQHAAGDNPAEEPMKPIDELRRKVVRDHSRLDKVPWDLDVKFAGGPACSACPKNSRNQTGLFEGTLSEKSNWSNYCSNGKIDDKAAGPEGAGVCLNLACFRAKNNASKSAIRGAGDRIAGKAAKLAEKERPVEVGRLVREATEKASFVKPTIFGKQVRERVQAKLEQSAAAKKSKTSGGVKSYNSYDSPEAKAERAAKTKFGEAQSKWVDPVFKLLEKRLHGKPVTTMLIGIATSGSDFQGARVYGHEPKKKIAEKAKRRRDAGMLLVAAAKGGPALETDETLKLLAKSGAEEITITKWQFEDMGDLLIDLLRAMGEDADIADPPKWDDFDPAKKKAEEPAKAKPAAKDRTPAKAGKKKTKMSKSKTKPAATAMDAAGEIDPQDEV